MTVVRITATALLTLFLASGARSAETEAPRNLEIYFVSVNGASTLIVTPLGESLLVDAGSWQNDGRDAERISEAAEHAGLTQIDCFIATHFHSDHIGGILPLSQRIPIKRFMDKGEGMPPNEENSPANRQNRARYLQAAGGETETIHLGDDVPLKNDPDSEIPTLKLHCYAVGEKVEGFEGDVNAPVSGHDIREINASDNDRCMVLLLSYGKFQFLLPGDITWNVEHHLAHPKNLIGEVDLLQVSHHGVDTSNNPILMRALNPTVCVVPNGPNKGVAPNTFRTLKSLPGLEALYQYHYNAEYGEEGNTELPLIANGKDPQQGNYIHVTVGPGDERFTVTIGSDGSQRTFPVKDTEE